MKSKHGFTVTDGFTEEQIIKAEAFPSLEEQTTWILNNLDKLHELDPEWNERLKETIQNSNPIYTANIIQSVADNMHLWINELPGADRPVKRESKINGYIRLIDETLRPEGYSTKIEMAAVENVRAELTEWRGILTGLLSGKTKQNKHSVATLAIFHLYSGQKITATNKNGIAVKYGVSSTTLFREYTKYSEKSKLVDISTTNKKSANEHIKRFEAVLEMLREPYPQSFFEASKDLGTIKRTYERYYN